MGEESGGIPPQIFIGFMFMMVMLAIAGVNLRMSRNRRAAEKETTAIQERLSQQDSVVAAQRMSRQEAVSEAIRRDPSFADNEDPESMAKLAQSVAAIQEEFALRAEVEAHKHREDLAQMERERQERYDTHQAEKRAAQQQAWRKEEARLAAMNPVRRVFAKNPGMIALIAVVIGVVGFGIVASRSNPLPADGQAATSSETSAPPGSPMTLVAGAGSSVFGAASLDGTEWKGDLETVQGNISIRVEFMPDGKGSIYSAAGLIGEISWAQNATHWEFVVEAGSGLPPAAKGTRSVKEISGAWLYQGSEYPFTLIQVG